MRISGGCLCGAVRYEGDATPMFQLRCYCVDCRKTSGAGHAASMVVGADEVVISGRTEVFKSKADSGSEVSRAFCPTCGSQVYARNSGMPQAIALRAATLDDPAAFSPQIAVFASRAPEWDRPPSDAYAFEEMPPRP